MYKLGRGNRDKVQQFMTITGARLAVKPLKHLVEDVVEDSQAPALPPLPLEPPGTVAASRGGELGMSSPRCCHHRCLPRHAAHHSPCLLAADSFRSRQQCLLTRHEFPAA